MTDMDYFLAKRLLRQEDGSVDYSDWATAMCDVKRLALGMQPELRASQALVDNDRVFCPLLTLSRRNR